MMHPDSKSDIRKRLVAYVDANSTDYAESTLPVEPWRYYDPEYLARELERVVRRHPLIVAHASELEAPGAFLTTNAGGVPLLVVRQDDGGVKAFANVCRHRGAKVELEQSGRRKLFSCPYHRWCYGRAGEMRSMPFDDGFLGVDRGDLGLVECPADEYAGHVWVIPRVGEPLDMRALVGPELDKDIQASRVGEAVLYRKETFHLDMNWKVVMDGFTDAYHLQFVHPQTVGPFFHTNVYAFDGFGKNSRMVVARKGIADFRDDSRNETDFRTYAISNFTIYPGTVITTEPTHFEVWSVGPDPDDLSRCYVTLRLEIPEAPQTEKAERFWEKNWQLLMDTVPGEDWAVAGTIGAGLATGDIPDLVYGRNEKATQFLHAQLAADTAAE